MRLVDSHAHLSGEEFNQDRIDVIQRALHSNIVSILCPGELTDPQNIKTALDISAEFTGILVAAGVHPHLAKDCDPACFEKIEELAHSRKIHAVGEIGLDYHYNHSPPDIQREVFHQQLNIAQNLQLPVVIHSRNAGEDVKAAVNDENFTSGGIIHCFTEDWDFAKHMMDCNFLISFSGILTYPKAHPLREVAAKIPLEKLLVETDSPYLVPEPYRGKIKRNEPIYVRNTAHMLADLKNTAFEQMANVMTQNFESLFQIAL
ncbi:MAG: TatD family hydrolase [Candidatus Aminicenantes bacterium]|nr:TatD family hydrolase [Candidatus Aminicenantes bacterium]